MSIETQPLTLGANESREVDFTGEYFELRSAVYAVALIELLDRSGGVRARLKDPLESDFCRPGRFEKIRVTNGATAQTVKFAFGTGDAGSRRSSGTTTVAGTVNVAGTVDVVDGGKARSLANAALTCWGNAPAGAAGTYAAAQLWNPAASGKSLIINRVTIASTIATGFVLVSSNAQLANPTAQQPMSKLLGTAAAAAALSRYAQGAAAGANILALANGPANSMILYVPPEPIVVPPGYGLHVQAQTAAADVSASWDWFEQAYP